MVAAVVVLVLGLGGFAVCATGVALQVLPRRFTAAQQQSITGWEVAARWRRLSAGEIFHSSITYQPTTLLTGGGTSAITLAAQRLGIAPQSSCAGALDSRAAAALDRRGCEEVLRATYADTTDSYVVTVGVAVLPSAGSAHTAAAALADRSSQVDGVWAAAFDGTASGQFTNSRRQLGSSFSAGPYVVLYTVGYSGGRPALPVSGDQYVTAEMTSLASGVAHSVANTLAAEPATPHCPGAPGC
jgi:hypothetical protein